MTLRLLLLSSWLILVLGCPVQTPLMVYVDAGADPNGASGATWATAFPTFKAAFEQLNKLDKNTHIIIAVKKGKYQPANGDLFLLNLSEYTNLELLGGFAGTSENLNDRISSQASDTILSGEWLVFEGQIPGNALSVVAGGYKTNALITIKGFTITGGNGNNKNTGGGAVFLTSSTITKPIISIEDVVFADNSAKRGGGLAISRSIVKLKNVLFRSNKAVEYGGGIYSSDSDLQIEGSSRFSDNSARVGGAFYNDGERDAGAIASLTDVIFESTISPGKKDATFGGAIYNGQYAYLFVERGKIIDHAAEFSGGGVENVGKSVFKNVEFKSNSSGNYGGAILNQQVGVINIEGGSLLTNKAKLGGGLFNFGKATVKGTRFEGNEANDRGGAVFTDEKSSLTLRKEDKMLFKDDKGNTSFSGVFNEKGTLIEE